MKELSEFFQSERNKRGLTIESVSERSGVSIAMLRFFEAGDFQSIGAELLIRNTIRGYCKVFELDPEPFLKKCSAEIEALKYQEEGIKRYGQLMKVLRKRRRMISLPLMLFALATGLVMYGGAWISEKRARLYAPPAADLISSQEDLPAELRQKLALLPGEPRQQRLAALSSRRDTDLKEAEKAIREAEKNIREAEKTRETETTAEADRAREDTAIRNDPVRESSGVALSNSMEVMAEERPATSQEIEKPYRFAVDATDKTWVQVRIDDKETRSAMLYPGDKREWTAKKGMQVVIGNAGGVTMKWEDQPVRAVRESGRVLRFRLPEQIGMIGN